MRITTVLRVVHALACSIGVCAFAIAVLRWFLYRVPFDNIPSIGELARAGGLIAGLLLGSVLLWGALRPGRTHLKAATLLSAAWISVFAWYWFNSFALNELHSFDPEKIAREQAQHTTISLGFFLLWTGLYLVGPTLKARQRPH
jgi:hypothetical protein